MKLNYIKRLIFLSLLLIINYSYTQVPVIEWQKSLGGTGFDFGYQIQQTSDGGYIIAGETTSNNGDVSGNHGQSDFWIIKITSLGVIEWQKALGGTSFEFNASIQQTLDGGYIIAGETESNNGNVSGNHGQSDFWIVKLTSLGVIQWQKALGGSSYDNPRNIIQTLDGGYIVSGTTLSNNGDVFGNHGDSDFWVVKLNSVGVIQWQKTMGGTSADGGGFIIQSIDGGYIVAGTTNSNNGDVSGNHGQSDLCIFKLSSLGNIEWQKTLGGSLNDIANCIQQTLDGGYIVAGTTNSNNGDVSGNHGQSDFWIVKLTSLGVIQWQKTLGGSSFEFYPNIQQTTDGGYIIGGATFSNDFDITGNHGNSDYWVVKIDSFGIIEWQKTLGGTLEDKGYSIKQTTDGYIIVGETESNDGDVLINKGIYDAWVVKLIPENLSNNSFTNNTLLIYPNPTKDNITLKLNYFSPNQEIIITDILGKKIHNQKLEGLTTIINTSDLSSGIYFLNLCEGSYKIVKKFIKE